MTYIPLPVTYDPKRCTSLFFLRTGHPSRHPRIYPNRHAMQSVFPILSTREKFFLEKAIYELQEVFTLECPYSMDIDTFLAQVSVPSLTQLFDEIYIHFATPILDTEFTKAVSWANSIENELRVCFILDDDAVKQ